MTLEECDYEKLKKIYDKYFDLGYLNVHLEKRLALIALICNVTYRINSKKDSQSKVSCYDVICKIGKEYPDLHKHFYKSLGVVCDSFMYGCTEFPDFGLDPKDMPKTIKSLLESYVPF